MSLLIVYNAIAFSSSRHPDLRLARHVPDRQGHQRLPFPVAEQERCHRIRGRRARQGRTGVEVGGSKASSGRNHREDAFRSDEILHEESLSFPKTGPGAVFLPLRLATINFRRRSFAKSWSCLWQDSLICAIRCFGREFFARILFSARQSRGIKGVIIYMFVLSNLSCGIIMIYLWIVLHSRFFLSLWGLPSKSHNKPCDVRRVRAWLGMLSKT